jgi:hypothetical protein
VNELIARLTALLVEPRAEVAVAPRASRERRAFAAAAVVVLGGAGTARTGVSVAAALARAGRAPHGVACVWGAAPASAGLPPLPAAAAAAAKLRARDHDARAGGRVVTVALPGDEREAAAACARVGAAVAGRRDVPLVLALCGARRETFDAGFGSHDLALVLSPADADPLLATVAVARLSERHPGLPVAHAELGACGRFAPPPRAAVRAVLEALR